jgi:hypothetical protein
MAEAAGARSGQPDASVPLSTSAEAEALDASDDEETVADATEEGEPGSRWSIARFTRGLGDI